MTLSAVEAFALIAAGFVCGISIGFGFALAAIRTLFASTWTRLNQAAWIAAMVTGMVFTTMAPVFLMAYMVFGSDPKGPLFWPRMTFFVSGVLVGAVFAFGSALLISRGYRSIVASDA